MRIPALAIAPSAPSGPAHREAWSVTQRMLIPGPSMSITHSGAACREQKGELGSGCASSRLSPRTRNPCAGTSCVVLRIAGFGVVRSHVAAAPVLQGIGSSASCQSPSWYSQISRVRPPSCWSPSLGFGSDLRHSQAVAIGMPATDGDFGRNMTVGWATESNWYAPPSDPKDRWAGDRDVALAAGHGRPALPGSGLRATAAQI